EVRPPSVCSKPAVKVGACGWTPGGPAHGGRSEDRAVEEGRGADAAEEILRGDACDLGEGLLGEKCLVRGHESIREGKQARQFVVGQHLTREVLEEDAFLLLVDVERDAAEAAGVERC